MFELLAKLRQRTFVTPYKIMLSAQLVLAVTRASQHRIK